MIEIIYMVMLILFMHGVKTRHESCMSEYKEVYYNILIFQYWYYGVCMLGQPPVTIVIS